MVCDEKSGQNPSMHVALTGGGGGGVSGGWAVAIPQTQIHSINTVDTHTQHTLPG